MMFKQKKKDIQHILPENQCKDTYKTKSSNRIDVLTALSCDPDPRIDLRMLARSSNMEARLVREWCLSLSCWTRSIPLAGPLKDPTNFFILAWCCWTLHNQVGTQHAW